MLAIDRCPPTYSKDNQRNNHHDFVYTDGRAGDKTGEPQLAGILLHIGDFIDSGLLHRRFYQDGIHRTGTGYVRLCLQAGIERVTDKDELLHFLKLISDLGGFRLIQVMGV